MPPGAVAVAVPTAIAVPAAKAVPAAVAKAVLLEVAADLPAAGPVPVVALVPVTGAVLAGGLVSVGLEVPGVVDGAVLGFCPAILRGAGAPVRLGRAPLEPVFEGEDAGEVLGLEGDGALGDEGAEGLG